MLSVSGLASVYRAVIWAVTLVTGCSWAIYFHPFWTQTVDSVFFPLTRVHQCKDPKYESTLTHVFFLTLGFYVLLSFGCITSVTWETKQDIGTRAPFLYWVGTFFIFFTQPLFYHTNIFFFPPDAQSSVLLCSLIHYLLNNTGGSNVLLPMVLFNK